MIEQERRTAFIQSLRDCADFFEAHPELREPHYTVMNVFAANREELGVYAKASSWTKEWTEQWFFLRKRFSEDLVLEINTGRETVCRKVVRGMRLEPAKPAQPEHEVEDFEWICDEPLLAG